MIWIVIAVVVLVAGALAATWGRLLLVRAQRGGRPGGAGGAAAPGAPVPGSTPAVASPARGAAERRILFPFFAHTISAQALAAALRLARVEQATLVAVYLARVSFDLALDAPIPRQAEQAIPLQEAIEQEAARMGVHVDARIARGRTCRHALERAIAHERFDRVVIAAAGDGMQGFHPEDVAWLLTHARGEIIVIRPARGSETIGVDSAPGVAGARREARPLSGAAAR